MTNDEIEKGYKIRYKKLRSKCIFWTGRLSPKGYAIIQYDGKTRFVHRILYESVFGKMKSGFVTDHLCRNKNCVNVFHLEAVTNKENVLRGYGPPAINKRKTHCSNCGGEYHKISLGFRRCYRCSAKNNRKWVKKVKSIRALEAES